MSSGEDNAIFVVDDGSLRKYRHEIPNLIDDLDLSPYAYRLYGHLKRRAGDSGVCWEGARALARACRMGVATVHRAKKELLSFGLIIITPGDRRKGEADEIRIVDVWLRNMRQYAPDEPEKVERPAEEVRSSEDHPPIRRGSPRSSEDRKKEPSPSSKETSPHGEAKKPPASSLRRGPRKKVAGLSEAEAERRWNALCEEDPHGADLRRMSELLAEENKTGAVRITRIWREIGERYVRAKRREGLTEEAWSYGFDEAISHEAPNIGYVMKCARSYRPSRRRGAVPSGGIAVANTHEEDYAEEGYR